jgi:hypothetical protein
MKLYRFESARNVGIRHALAIILVASSGTCLVAQPLLIPGQNNANFFGNGNQNNVGNGNNGNANQNGQGGAAQADFDTLIDLIVATVAPDSWDDVGGSGSIQGFPGGVYVDAAGVMRRVDPNTRSLLAKRIRRFQESSRFTDDDLSQRSELRKVSLVRLENAIRALALHGEPPTEAMKFLAGLERIDYVVIDKLNNDVILVGPADQWIRSDDGRIVSYSTRRPVLQLDDFVVLLRNALDSNSQFTCSITPTQKGLADFRSYVDRTTLSPLKPGKGARSKWVDGLQQSLGNQTVEVQGLPAETRVGRVIVEADYHMKLIGIGLETGTDEVESYLDSIKIAKGQSPPPMGILRWWFTLDDAPLSLSEDGSTFDLTQPIVQVLSENELLTKIGKRVHTGQSDTLNRRFAGSFTKHFESLAKRYPVYADLENVFELAIVASVIQQEEATGGVSWSMSHFIDADKYRVETARVPREVPSIINHRVINGKHVVCAVSGGVSFPGRFETASSSDSTSVSINTGGTGPVAASAWWWD